MIVTLGVIINDIIVHFWEILLISILAVIAVILEIYSK